MLEARSGECVVAPFTVQCLAVIEGVGLALDVDMQSFSSQNS